MWYPKTPFRTDIERKKKITAEVVPNFKKGFKRFEIEVIHSAGEALISFHTVIYCALAEVNCY